MRYYLYISDLKVEQLFQQLPFWRRFSINTSVKLNLKIVDFSLGNKEQDRSKYVKLNFIENYLEKQKLISSIEENNQYLKGEGKFNWGDFSPYALETESKNLVYFFSKIKDYKVFLIASKSFLLGETGSVPATSAYLSPNFIKKLVKEISTSRDIDLNEDFQDIGVIAWFSNYHFEENNEAFQNLGFLAKTLYRKEDVIVASPVYVYMI